MLRLRPFLGFALCALALVAEGTPNSIDQGVAVRYFHEARALGDRDAARLWGQLLYGPMLFVDGSTRSVMANEPNGNGLLRPSGEGFEGTLPEGVPIANTATTWSGVHWTMVMWPLPEDRHAREKLLMHECFHRIQKDLGLEIPDRPCSHLDTKEGRIWLQLEWRALGEALCGQGRTRRRSIQDALLFRSYRRSLFAGAAEAERAMELNEGLAEYTGIRASARSGAQSIADALVGLDSGARKPTFVRSFAYASGPPYGLLLDASAPRWRDRVKEQPDLGDLLRKALSIQSSPDWKHQAQERALNYGLRELDQDETRREEVRKANVARYQSRLVDGPVLILPRSAEFTYSFNPNNLIPLGESGMVYPTLEAHGPWGTLEVSGGALMTATDLRVTAPDGPKATPLKGTGWSLDLSPGWVVSPDSRKGDYRLIQEIAPPDPKIQTP
jgi:hypothetical protein